MKAGFLGGKPISKEKQNSKPPVCQAESPAPQARHEAPQAHTPTAQPRSLGAGPNPASWQQCMELLKSNSDEKKFVGLLLVTKLLPHGNDEALTSVLDAVGWPFLQRMLLPLQQQHQDPQQQQQQTDDQLQQQQLSVALGLSIISAVARVQDVAGSEELLQLAPLLSKVAAAGGVAAALQQQQQEDKVTACVDAAADLAAAADALDCLLACASSGSYQQSVLLESNGLHTAAAALASALTITQQCHTAAASAANGAEAAATAGAAAAARAAMLSIQLLGVLLEGDAAARAGLITQHQTQAAAAVMLLAAVFGGQLPEQHSPPASKQGRVQATDAAALQLDALHALLLLLPLPEAALQTQWILSAAALALAAAAAAGADVSQAAGAAAVKAAEATAAAAADHSQPGAAAPQASRQLLLRAAAAAAGDWGLALRQGLVQVLRSRVGAVQRHSALQLAAAVLEVLGPNWLLPQQQQQQQGPQAAASSSSSSRRPEEFLLVLVEVLAIETPLLLSDAMNAGAAVPRSDAAMDAAAAAAAALSSESAALSSSQQGPAPDGDSDVSDGDVEMDDSSQPRSSIQPLSVREAVQQQQQQSAQQRGEDSQPPSNSKEWSGPPGFQQQKGQQQLKPLRQQLAELKLPEDKPVGRGQQQAGARALQCLPSCYQLLEGCLEVLVQQVGLLDDLADLSQPHTQHHDTAGPTAAAAGAGAGMADGGDGSSGSVGGDGVGGRAVSWQEMLPVLGLPQVDQLMGRMAQVTEVVCEFLQHATSQAAGEGEAGSAAPINPWLVVGAVRLLGRFLADAPDMHAAVVRALLPRLLQLQDSSNAEVPTAAERVSREGVAGGSVSLQVVSFLLPAMLSWTSKHSDQHQQWVEFMLSPSSGCLDALAAYAVHATTASAAAGVPAPAAAVNSSSSSSSGGGDGADDDAGDAGGHLGSVCQVLFQLLSGRAVLLSARAQQHQQQQPAAAAPCALPALQPAQAAALSAVLQGLCSWSVEQCQRRQQVQQQQGAPQASVPQAIAAAEAVLVGLQGMGLQLSTFQPAAALTGQLLELVGPPAGGAPAGAGAAKLLCWGCEVGWSLQLLAAYQQSSAAGGSCLAMPRVVLQQLLQVWEVAELDELWEACLLITAGLLTQLGPGSVLHHMLADAGNSGGWLSSAMQGVSVQGPKGDAGEAAAAVVDASTSLQLLLQAVSATV